MCNLQTTRTIGIHILLLYYIYIKLFSIYAYNATFWLIKKVCRKLLFVLILSIDKKSFVTVTLGDLGFMKKEKSKHFLYNLKYFEKSKCLQKTCYNFLGYDQRIKSSTFKFYINILLKHIRLIFIWNRAHLIFTQWLRNQKRKVWQ